MDRSNQTLFRQLLHQYRQAPTQDVSAEIAQPGVAHGERPDVVRLAAFPKVVRHLVVRVCDAAPIDAARGEHEEQPDAVVGQERVEELDNADGDDENLHQRPEPDVGEHVEDGQPREEELRSAVREEAELVIELAPWGVGE